MTATTTGNTLGVPTNLKTMKKNTHVRNMNFVFDTTIGNLTSRTGMIVQQETFVYDNLNWLTTTGTMSMIYATNSNIMSKTGLSEYFCRLPNPMQWNTLTTPTG